MRIIDAIVSRQEICRGWSADRKYKALTAEGTAYFLRVSPAEQYERRRREFDHMRQVHALGVTMSDPVEFGCCDEGCYTLLRWVEGRDAEAVLPELTGEERRRYGLEAGRMLRAIHTLPAPEALEPWHIRWCRKANGKIAAYESCPLKYGKGELFLELIRTERHLVEGRPTVWHHGDFHCGNLMFDDKMRLTVIDFDRDDAGDPWYEFNRIIWDVRVGGEFAGGMLDGYFGGEIPEKFWRILRLYLCQNMIASLPWAVGFGNEEIRTAVENAEQVLRWYDDLKEVVPNWYCNE